MSHSYGQHCNCFGLYRKLRQQLLIFVMEALEMIILHSSDTYGCYIRLHDLQQVDIVVL